MQAKESPHDPYINERMNDLYFRWHPSACTFLQDAFRLLYDHNAMLHRMESKRTIRVLPYPQHTMFRNPLWFLFDMHIYLIFPFEDQKRPKLCIFRETKSYRIYQQQTLPFHFLQKAN